MSPPPADGPARLSKPIICGLLQFSADDHAITPGLRYKQACWLLRRFFKKNFLRVVHGSVDELLASPQRGEVGGGNTWTMSSPAHRRLWDHPPPGLPPLGGGHTLQHGVGGRRAGVETRGEPFPVIT